MCIYTEGGAQKKIIPIGRNDFFFCLLFEIVIV